MNLKRLLSLCVATILVVMMCLQGALVYAIADKVTFSLACTDGGVGDTFTVTVSVTPDSCFTNATVYLHYNTSAVEFVKEKTGEVASSGTMFYASNKPDNGYVQGAFISAYPIEEGGELFVFTFKAIADKAAGFSLSFDECNGEDANGNLIDLNYSTTTCVFNEKAGGDVTPTTVPKTTTKPTSSANTTTKAPVNGTTTTVAAPTTTVTYPTDTNGITLAPNVVTEPNGNAATQPNGEVVTIQTTQTTTSVFADLTQTTTVPTEQDESGSFMWLIVLGVVVLAAGGVTVGMLLMRKKKQSV